MLSRAHALIAELSKLVDELTTPAQPPRHFMERPLASVMRKLAALYALGVPEADAVAQIINESVESPSSIRDAWFGSAFKVRADVLRSRRLTAVWMRQAGHSNRSIAATLRIHPNHVSRMLKLIARGCQGELRPEVPARTRAKRRFAHATHTAKG